MTQNCLRQRVVICDCTKVLIIAKKNAKIEFYKRLPTCLGYTLQSFLGCTTIIKSNSTRIPFLTITMITAQLIHSIFWLIGHQNRPHCISTLSSKSSLLFTQVEEMNFCQMLVKNWFQIVLTQFHFMGLHQVSIPPFLNYRFARKVYVKTALWVRTPFKF